jgi:hypothetical protein
MRHPRWLACYRTALPLERGGIGLRWGITAEPFFEWARFFLPPTLRPERPVFGFRSFALRLPIWFRVRFRAWNRSPTDSSFDGGLLVQSLGSPSFAFWDLRDSPIPRISRGSSSAWG